MITNYFEDLWEKAEKLGVSKHKIGVELFGEKNYRNIYYHGRISKHMQNRYNLIDETIDKLAKRK